MNYTVGNWSVSSLTTDTIVATKNVALTDLDYVHDYAESGSSADEATMSNVTGSSFVTPEKLRYARSTVADIYAGTDVPSLNRFAVKTGLRTLTEVRFNVQAVNSVSGEEVLLPMKGWICLQVPNASLVTDAAVLYLLKRTMSCAFNTGLVDAAREAEIARGALLP